MKKTSFYIILLLSVVSFAQENNTVDIEELNFMENHTYKINSELFKNQNYTIRIEDKEFEMPWKKETYSEKQLNQALDSIIDNASMKIAESFSSHSLVFKSYFPEFIDKDKLPESLKLTIKSSSIKNKESLLDIQKDGFSNYGSIAAVGLKNGEEYNKNWTTFDKKFSIRPTIETEVFEGVVEFEIALASTYDYLKIEAEDLNKKLKIGNHSFTLVNIFNNAIVIAFDDPIDSIGKISFVNLNDKGQKITSSESNGDKTTIFKNVYEMFKENPELTLVEYKKVMRPKFIEVSKNRDTMDEANERLFGSKYLVFSTFEELQNAYVYIPRYNSKVFKKEYIENEEERSPKIN